MIPYNQHLTGTGRSVTLVSPLPESWPVEVLNARSNEVLNHQVVFRDMLASYGYGDHVDTRELLIPSRYVHRMEEQRQPRPTSVIAVAHRLIPPLPSFLRNLRLPPCARPPHMTILA
jgi:hypothetical protein